MNFKSFFSNWIVKNLLLAALILAVLIVGAGFLLKVMTRHNEEIRVPDFSNMTVSEARTAALAHNVRVEVTDSVYLKRMARGTVYRQVPEAGSHVKKGRRISLTINSVLPQRITMPNLIGYSTRQAKAELSSRGLNLGKLIYVNDIATNNVLAQIYNNMEIEPGAPVESESTIDLVVGLSGSDNKTYIPTLYGTKYMAAIDAVHNSSLNVSKITFDKTVKSYSDTLNAFVYRQEPDTSSVTTYLMGSEMALYFTLDESKIPEPQIDSLSSDAVHGK